jgi:hypothetical protein
VVGNWTKVQAHLSSAPLFFLKNPAVQRGQGIFIFNQVSKPKSLDLPPVWV